MIRFRIAALAALMTLALADVVQAQGIDFCTIIANRLTPDLTEQNSASSRFLLFQRIISDERFRDANTARSTALDTGISVFDYVDGFLGVTSDSSNWEQNWTRFKESIYSQASSSFSRATFESVWSVQLITALAERCSNDGRLGGLVTSVTPLRDAFSIRLNGQGNWLLTGLQISPPDAAVTCNGHELASPTNPIPLLSVTDLVCSKDPNKTIILTALTSLGSAGPFTIQSRIDAIADAYAEEVAALRNELAIVTRQLSEVAGRLNGVEFRNDATGLVDKNTFWTAEEQTHVDFTCPPGQVLAGFGFDAWSDGTIRGIGTVVFHCQRLFIPIL